MSYDYSSAGKTLELPNPYKVQNSFLLLSGGVLIVAGVLPLIEGRATLAPIPLAIGIALLFAGFFVVGMAAKRLRFFFGRGRPQSLAPEVPPTVDRDSQEANQIKQLLREGALRYPEPIGAIDNVLYHWTPKLITAPLAVQEEARIAFFNMCAMVTATFSFLVAWMVFGTEASRPLLSIAYFAFGLFFLLTPFIRTGRARLDTKTLVLLIAAAIVGPALVAIVSKSMPPMPFSLASQTFMLLGSGTAAAALLLLAALQQVASPPPTQTSSEQLRLSLNVPPSMLMDELERRMQEQWTERIPNRRYARATPVIQPDVHSGPFNGELLEETQPTPIKNMVPSSVAQALTSSHHRFLAGMDLYATVLTMVAAVCAVLFARSALAGEKLPLNLFGASSIFLAVAGFCFRSSARLWGRFDFQSFVTWVEMNGTYQTASVGTGNQLTSKIQTSNQIVRTESMTLRIWRARVESVVFGKDGRRQITAMFSTDAEAKDLGRHLSEFGSSRGSLVAPGSAEDMNRLAALASAERAAGAPARPEEAAALMAPAVGAIASAENPIHAAQKFCRHCGAKNLADARFCQGCGEKFET